MPHLDEGHIHALLDGELTAAEREVAEEHLRACAECQQLMTEARGLFAEADRLVETLTPAAAREQAARQPTTSRPRLKNYQWLAWAATIVIAVGLGYSGSELLRPGAQPSRDAGLKQEALPATEAAP
jgi:anti-sigma factor RsiW